VLTFNVGGSFGMKGAPYPEYIPALHAARLLGRPVKWTDERSGSFVSDHHGPRPEMTGELALDANGRILALRVTGYANVGGALLANGPGMSTTNVVKNVTSVYRIPLLHVLTRNMLTNTTPIGAYRGAGRPESNYLMERLIELAARRPDAMPWRCAGSTTCSPRIALQGGVGPDLRQRQFHRVLNRALQVADWDGSRAAVQTARARPIARTRRRPVPRRHGAAEQGNGGIRFEADGTVTIISGTLDYGQGHATPFAQVLSARLGIPFARIRLRQSDSDEIVFGGGTAARARSPRAAPRSWRRASR